MFSIDILLLHQAVPRLNYLEMSIDEIYRFIPYEAELSISYRENVFFQETVSVVELYWFIGNWYRNYEEGTICDFHYASIEHNEPILCFSKSESASWSISSIWGHGVKSILIDEPSFIQEIDNFVSRLNDLLEAQN